MHTQGRGAAGGRGGAGTCTLIECIVVRVFRVWGLVCVPAQWSADNALLYTACTPGMVDDVFGWDFGGSCVDAACSSCTPGPYLSDGVGWGTHASSVIAGAPQVAVGTAVCAPGVRFLPPKVAACGAAAVRGPLVTTWRL